MEKKLAKFIGYHETAFGIELHNTIGYVTDTKTPENVMFYPSIPNAPWQIVLSRKEIELL